MPTSVANASFTFGTGSFVQAPTRQSPTPSVAPCPERLARRSATPSTLTMSHGATPTSP